MHKFQSTRPSWIIPILIGLVLSGVGAAGSHPVPTAASPPRTGESGLTHPSVAGAATSVPGAPAWVQLVGTAPSARVGQMMAYDPPENESILFGGHIPPPASNDVNDTWGFANDTWTNLTLGAGVAPFPRSGGGMVYDPVDGYMVLFGGATNAGVSLNDTWTFAAGSWHRLSTEPAPSPRFWPSMTWDSSDQEVVLFGGINATGTYLNDTWGFVHGRWSNLTTQGFAPAGRAFAGFADDPDRGGAILNGGRTTSSSVPFPDTDLFAHGIWSTVPSATAPPGRANSMMVRDPSAGGIFLFGGFNGSVGNNYYNDSWVLNGSGWSPVSVGGAPPPRAAGGIAVNGPSGGPVIFGGAGTSVDLGDTWIFDQVEVNATSAGGSGTVPFSWTASANPTGGWPPYRVSWDFGDGNVTGGVVGDHTFERPGYYNVTVQATDRDGFASSPAKFVVIVLASPLSASVGANRTGGPAPLAVGFMSTVTGGVGPYTLNWSFDDGSGSSAIAPTHTFTAAGTFTVTLTVQDAAGGRTEAFARIVVTSPVGVGPCCSTSASTPWFEQPAGIAVLALVGIGLIAGVILAVWYRRRNGTALPDGPASAADPELPDSPDGPVDDGSAVTPPDDPPPGEELPAEPPDPTELPPDDLARSTELPRGSTPSSLGTPLPPSRPLSDQILVHLYRLPRADPDASYPTGYTQDGMSSALGRPQGAFARSLLRLEEGGLVTVGTAHVQGRARRLKVYTLTARGEGAARRLAAEAGTADPP